LVARAADQLEPTARSEGLEGLEGLHYITLLIL
jgi:hypothetical protein